MEKYRNNGNKSKNKERNAEGSRFYILEKEVNEQDETDFQKEANSELNMSTTGSARLGGADRMKGRRPSVQVSEKQIMRNNAVSTSKNNENKNKEKITEAPGRGMGYKQHNRAGAAEEHVVVRGEKNGEIIIEERVMNEGMEQASYGLPKINIYEHFSDPPYTRGIDVEGVDMDYEEFPGDDVRMHEVVPCMHADVVMHD